MKVFKKNSAVFLVDNAAFESVLFLARSLSKRAFGHDQTDVFQNVVVSNG